MSTMTDVERLVLAREMFDAWERLDWDAVVDLFADTGVLHSVMQEPVVGREAIAERMAVLGSKATRLELRVCALGIIDDRVFVERVDDFEFDGHHGHVPSSGSCGWPTAASPSGWSTTTGPRCWRAWGSARPPTSGTSGSGLLQPSHRSERVQGRHRRRRLAPSKEDAPFSN